MKHTSDMLSVVNDNCKSCFRPLIPKLFPVGALYLERELRHGLFVSLHILQDFSRPIAQKQDINSSNEQRISLRRVGSHRFSIHTEIAERNRR